tara:strand:- start:8650 stop:8952 length:303 start_codon:yes stop_codon:yes gene_type:complete
MATGSGAKESDAQRDNVKPSATWAGTFSLISLNLLRAVVVSSFMTNKGSCGSWCCLGFLSHDMAKMPKSDIINAVLNVVMMRMAEIGFKKSKIYGYKSVL